MADETPGIRAFDLIAPSKPLTAALTPLRFSPAEMEANARFQRQDGVVDLALVLDDGPEDGSGFTPLLEADLVNLIATARVVLGIEVDSG